MKNIGKSLILLSFLSYKLILFRIINCWLLKSFLIKRCLTKITLGMESLSSCWAYWVISLSSFRMINSRCWKSCLKKIKVSLVSLPTVTQMSKCTFKFDPISGMGFDKSRFYRINSLWDLLQLNLLEIEALAVALCSRIYRHPKLVFRLSQRMHTLLKPHSSGAVRG